jgi:tetratricopeptide (TPR) repeat protein
MATDWFRRESWSPEAAREFDARLRRTRAANRAQYLRIQASHLVMVSLGWAEAALSLLGRLVAEYPDEMQLAPAHHQRAECLLALGRPDEAIAAFSAALAAQRAFPLVATDAHAAFAYTVAATARADLFDEALAALAEFGGLEFLPVQAYAASAARALIAARRGDVEGARGEARLALGAAERPAAAARLPRGMGEVRYADADALTRLRRLATSSSPPTPSTPPPRTPP